MTSPSVPPGPASPVPARTPHRAILGAAVPLLLSMSVSVVAQLVGTVALGRRETAALAAFALASAVLSPVTAAVAAGLRGLAPFVAPHRDDPARALPVLRDARWLSLAFGTAGAGVVLCVPPLARAAGAPGEVVDGLGALPPLLALEVLLFAAGGGANTVLVALGRSRQVLWSSLSGTAVQVGLILLLTPGLGVDGIGLALVASTAVSVTVSNICLLRVPGLAGPAARPSRWRSPAWSLWPVRPRPREIARMARVGVPMSTALIVKFAVLGGATYVAARTGAQGAAAHAVLRSLAELLALAAFSVGQATAPEITRAASPGSCPAGSSAEVRRVGRAALSLAGAGAACGALVLLCSGSAVTGLFTTDAEVASLVADLLPPMVVYAVANGCGIVMSACLVGLKRPSWGLLAAVAGYGLLALAALPATAAWGLTGLWTAMAVGAVLIFALQLTGFVRHSARTPLAVG
ncbi:hypothetical protein GCM10010466_05790 [Planomonospora alba]|uniref:Probable multidrug resistance protein NorM n=1 Tax=Planomonospora alba TaxID=161354 RepID=A0ABP6MKI8_9ACTN